MDPQDAEHLELLRRTVDTPSVSGDESRVAHDLVAWMNAHGFDARVDDAGNAVGSRGRGARHVVLLGHIDTVPGDIPVRVENGELWGRGSVDAKGPFCTFLAAVATLPDDALAAARFTCVGAVEEEAPTSKGARHVMTRLEPDLCVIGEPSGWDAVTLGYKGRLVARASVEKPNFHSAGDDTTAAEDVVTVWNRVRDWAARENAGVTGVFDAVQAALQSIQSATDGLHQRAEAVIGLRLPPRLEPDAAARALEAARDDAGLAAVRFAFTGHERPYRGPRDTPLTRAFRVAIRAEGGEPTLKLKTGTSDMNVVAPAWNCPMLAYGPGDSALDHTPEERVRVEDYLRAIRVLRTALARAATA